MEFSILISPDGEEIKTISILEDYWHDYLYFKEQANLALKEDSQLKNRRYSRAALLVLMAYLEGVVNQWSISILEQDGKSESQIDAYIRKKWLHLKCDDLTKEASKKGSRVDDANIKRVKELRNDLAHLTPGKDAELFEEITESILTEAEEVIIPWLDAVGTLIGKERHPDTKEIGRGLANALGQITQEEYSGK
ncbi:MAG TPA: hypothetical protein VEW46_02065 [Pyrinomonadaceae bacterium]|nr:hypothetical protein [Pyrinomonadaceae bacterium]